MSEPVSVKVDDTRILERLKKIAERGENLRKPLLVCGEIMMTSIEENFLQQGRFSTKDSWRGGSNRWQKLADSSNMRLIGGSRGFKRNGKMRAKSARIIAKHKILQLTGQLAASIHPHVSGNSLEVGTNKVYGAAHQFGFNGMVNVPEHKRTSSRGKSYSVRSFKRKMTLPARPFLVVQDQDVTDMVEALDDYIMSN